MMLERFNHYGKLIDFDTAQGKWKEVDSSSDIVGVNGIGDIVGDICVGLAVRSSRLLLFVGQTEFDLSDYSTDFNYKHKKDGNTFFSIRDKEKEVQLIYKSWWMVSPPRVAAFGTGGDEDEDFCAYIIFMTSDDVLKNLLVQKWPTRYQCLT